ncbi:phosphatidylinositol kinase (PIK-L4) [Phytophthora infestans T30-4]|uniref:Serine/threonine-protein kinase ATR n=1 Tax=Phytophthora infestans (strain T30-4) TaxID=403677 RepID=D0MWH0_PHYIT|nr:phosphatidylinositol kinase (PIK-L4) [Phytophthora infestans T30-4]EEY63983.1 phosphatidylinositol kinase (PIK-L4) [Phytophthora infestans T30-4]|eukprot:XP_002907419.1 phosphatidylinositol kinase (PIK-L4) [Phytophthora infestans T30-4]
MATRSSAEEAEKSDVDSLLRLVRAHQRQHDDRAYESSAPAAIRRCKTMLTKLRKILPKLMRPVATLSTDKAVPVLQDLCQLLNLLLGGGACPHSMTLFMESNANVARGEASGFPSYPTMATMLFYMVSFYTNDKLREAQRDVRDVTLQMVLFLQRNDVYGFIHFFRDTVQLLEDCFLLEESLKNRDSTDTLPGGASVACYLDTAIHVYQDADGPLGAKSNVTLCGCMPITDVNQLYERREQLKKMLPSIHVSSYGMVVALRQSVIVLADRIVREHNAMLEGDQCFDRLCQLVELFISKNEELAKNTGGESMNGAVSSQDADEVTRSTLRLLLTILQVSVSTERRFVRLSLMYLKDSFLRGANARTWKACAAILELISTSYPRLSKFASDALWPCFESWVYGNMDQVRGAGRERKHIVESIWMAVLSILDVYTRQSKTASAASLFIDMLELVDLKVLNPAMTSSVIDKIHYVLSAKEMLTKVVRFISKELAGNGPSAMNLSQSASASRKRKRNNLLLDTRDSSAGLRRDNTTELHEKLGRWLLDLISFDSGSDRKSILGISTGLRVILPLRRYIAAFARLESFAIFRALLQRVDLIVNTYAPSLTSLTSEYLDLWIILLRYFDDHEIEKYRGLLTKVVESVETQKIFERSLERDNAFVEPDCWEYLDFLQLYQRHPKCHDMSLSERLDEVSYEYVRSADTVLEVLFRKSVALRGPFLVYFVWSRPATLNIVAEDSWRNALPWRIVYRAILQETSLDVTVCSYLAMAPLLAFFVVAGSLTSPKKMATCIMEAFNSKIQRTGSDAISSAITQACGAVLCATAYGQASAEGVHYFNDRRASAVCCHSKSCQCRKIADGCQAMPIPLSLFEPTICGEIGSATEIMQVVKVNALSSVFEHCEVDYGNDYTAKRFVEYLLTCFEHRSKLVRQAVLESIAHQPRLLDAMIDPARDGLTGLIERLEGYMTAAEESNDDNEIAEMMLAAGSIGCECDPHQRDRGDNCTWILLRLVSLWNRFMFSKRSRCAVMAYSQICRITMHHGLSWRRLCVDFPELLYFPLIDGLLETRSLTLFLRTFMGGKVDIKFFLKASAPYVLPKYVVHQNEHMLHAFVAEFNGTEEDIVMAGDGADEALQMNVTNLLLNHLDYVLRDLLIHQVQAVSNENRLAEWEFLLKFLPENSTVRDVIVHSSLRLMNLLAWELGGPQSRMAKRAMREVANCLNEDAGEAETIEQVASLQPGEGCMPRQFFLALMTDLGNRISGKNSSAMKIRAIKSIECLLDLYGGSSADTQNSGVVDPFVPKVMATLKVGLTEHGLQEHAIQAWGNFLQMLSTKALEANLSSIVVSLLSCLGHESSAILIEDASITGSQCWNVESLENFRQDGTGRVGSLGSRDEAQMKCMTAAVGILRYLFIDKGAELKPSFPKIPLLPSIPELDEIYAVLYEEDGDPRCRPLREYLMNLSAYVNHLDVAVREMALTQLLRCLVVRGAELETLMQNEGDIFIDQALASVVQSILQLSRSECHEPIKLLCARCLGALGAIDGARVPLHMFYTSGPQGGAAVAKEKQYQKIEYSTKDLAIVLIEKWLVKELRAAPENTDSLAFAIQELLKFLAELTADPQHSGQSLSTNNFGSSYKSRQDSSTPMPDWMKRRFDRKDVLQFVEPYWSTNYAVLGGRSSHRNGSSGSDHRSSASTDQNLNPVRDDISFYEMYGTSYEDWILNWCRRLISLSQPPERKIFLACRTALPTCPQISRFVLPYLIQNVLRSGRPEVGKELKKEVMAVLDDQDCGVLVDDVLMAPPESEHTNDSVTSTGGASDRGVGEFFRRHDQCSQTIFSTFDELNEWIWTSEKKRLALSASAASRQTSASGRSDVASDIDDDREKEFLEEFVKGIPSRSLSNAAYQIKAYARAVQYFEVHLRQEEFNETEPRSTGVEVAGPIRLSLVSKNATYLQQLYKSVDEPDSLVGLASLRRLHDAHRHNDVGTDMNDEAQEEGLTLTDLMHEIVDHEQLAQWEDALACYEQAIQEIQSALSFKSLPPTRPLYSQLAMMQPPAQILDAENAHKDPDMIKPELYGGMIGCLIQLGRLESALQHINGIVTQEPQFMATMYPYALECSWRLSRWELLTDLLSTEKQNPLLHLSGSSVHDTASTRLKGFDVSQLMLVRVLHSLHGGQQEEFQRHLKAARLEVMGPLAAASAESYQRAYPLLHDLHFLHEAEQGFIFLQNAKESDDLSRRSLLWKKQTPWNIRYDAMATQLKYRDPILALRRVILHEAGLRNEVSENWLVYAKLTRKEGFIRTATSAVMHAQAMNNQYVSIEKAKLLVSQDRMYEALQVLEPVDIDASTLDYDVEDPHLCAKNLLLATNWMQKSGQRQGKKVIERYQAVIRFDPKWEKGYFFLAKYYEYLLNMSHPDALNGSMSSDEAADLLLDSVFHGYLISLMKNYVQALAHGTKFVFQSLPRLLTLWFDLSEVLYGSSSGRSSNKANKATRQIEIGLSQSTNEHKVLTGITQVVDEAIESLPAYEWLVCFPQVTSRICHPNPDVVDSVKRIMVQVLLAYPTQAMWSLLGLSRSLNSQRKNRAREIISSAQKQFLHQGLREIADSFSEGMKMAEELISLAAHDPGNSKRKIHIRLSRIRTRILVPIQAALTTILPTSGLAPRDEHHVAFSSNAQVYIKAFSDKADVMMTKEKPKRIEVLGTDGQLYPFLCKREKNGDLRKDARMMEFNSMINRLLQKDREGRKRKLRLRTYAVVCLNEESGLMEWVRHTRAMRQLIGQIHKTERGYIQPVRLTHEIKEQYLHMQKKYANNPAAMARFYCREVLSMPVFTPRFHQWFYNNFADPTAWFEARLMFSRSAAVWSMVGHIVGLGDRHGENILIDCTNGECVHVDFDCLFDKGLKLTKPEIVPFRLTPNIIDAFGITGYEGVFRRVSEVTMRLLRENKATLRSVLESFIHDPLVEWGRRGKTTQSDAVSSKTAAELSSERSKQETRLVLRAIDDRLRGIYNLGDAIRPLVSSSHRNILPENETLPLSVQGQVDKLIDEATSNENLAQMYIGWMPFL